MKELLNKKRVIAEAHEIAKRDLRACYSEAGILAGRKRFDDYWTRDFCNASMGSNILRDYKIVKRNFNLLLEHQKNNGQLPRRIDCSFIAFKYMGIKIKRKKLKAKYGAFLHHAPSVDQNSLFIIALLDYVIKSRDMAFIKKNFKKIKKTIDWNFTQDKNSDGLLEEGYFAGWEDNVFKRGKVLYTNVLHYKAIRDFVQLVKIAQIKDINTKDYLLLAEQVKEQINRRFWNGSYYIAWISRRRQRYFNSDGNLLAVVFGLASKEQARSIQRCIKNFGLDKHRPPLRNNWPDYPPWRLAPTRYLKISYKRNISWLWLGCLDVVAKAKLGMTKQALEELKQIAQTIIKYGNVYEIYHRNRPANTLFFKSEVPFAWSAGMFIYAVNELSKFK